MRFNLARVLLVANTGWSVFNFRHALISAMIDSGLQVVVLAPQDTSFESLRAMGCSTINLELSAKGVNPFAELLLIFRLYWFYKKIRPDFIFHYTIKPNIYGSIAAKLCRIKSVAVTTGLGYTFINDNVVARVAKYLYRFSFNFPEQVWFLNSEDRSEFLARNLVSESRAVQIPGEGIDLDKFYPVLSSSPDDSNFRFLLVGRMLWDKGVAEYVQAARIVRKTYPDATFQLLGACDEPNPSMIGLDQVMAWQEEGGVEYLGVVADVRSVIAQSDCVVLPSYREGVPRTLMEAAAMSKPLIATDVPGCRDVVKDAVNGFLCPMKDAEALALCCIRMLRLSREARESMGAAGRNLMVEQFDEKSVVRRYANFLVGHGLNINCH